MTFKDFKQAGHWPTLLAAFLYFDMSFMVWVILGPLAVHIAADLHLSASQKGMMVALPILSGALLRIPVGIAVDRFGPRRTGQLGQILVMASLALAWMLGIHTLFQACMLGLALGFAGASFAVALPQASRWYPPEYQGLALGIAGAGNSGTVFAGLFAPSLANAFGWNAVFGIVILPLAITFVLYTWLAKDPPQKNKPLEFKQYIDLFSHADTWLFMFFYLVTFGGFIGLASSLVIYFNDQFGLSPVTAGIYTSICVLAGSFFRPIGGAWADRVGGVKALSILYQVALACMLLISFGPTSKWIALALFVVAMIVLGMGNGSVFQLVPLRFRNEMGAMTGLVGMAGGVGGSLLAASLGWSKQITGSYQAGFLVFVALAGIAAVALNVSKARWRATWGAPNATAARV